MADLSGFVRLEAGGFDYLFLMSFCRRITGVDEAWMALSDSMKLVLACHRMSTVVHELSPSVTYFIQSSAALGQDVTGKINNDVVDSYLVQWVSSQQRWRNAE
ncbi:hypothetical protein HPB50_010742 [Hyalomma asiaticum]|uniref:Uncharacterized protein n=1 Tax=Hyalomma asiaticum TaxID=266040 RepID=A0ACB7T744_HYAAI|nr:hypothetical protein HPB50_010742 [Hyalomma asiaticum]